ncbi:MAG: hypothetical protein ABTD50_06145 [Polyangiaceae bacterium]
MQRIILPAWLVVVVCSTCSCTSNSGALVLPDGGTVEFGTPCEVTPLEDDPTFVGFALRDLSVASPPGASSTVAPGGPVCIVNHFQGRVSCPYGQSSDPDAGLPPCYTPSGVLVSGSTPTPPQCVDRPPEMTVTWSCRCDGNGGCQCPSGSECVDMGIVPGDSVGSYCLSTSNPYDGGSSCTPVCDPVAYPCQ